MPALLTRKSKFFRCQVVSRVWLTCWAKVANDFSIGYVDLQDGGFAAEFLDFGGDLVGFVFFLPVGDDDVGAVGG